jgi:DUF438 domain-containing protein
VRKNIVQQAKKRRKEASTLHPRQVLDVEIVFAHTAATLLQRHLSSQEEMSPRSRDIIGTHTFMLSAAMTSSRIPSSMPCECSSKAKLT